MSAWQVPLSIQQPNIQTPAQVQGQQLSLQQLAGQVAVNKQIQSENALKLQAAQEDQNDQNTIQKAFQDAAAKNPGGPIDYEKDIRGPLATQVRLRNLQALDADHFKMQQAAQDLALSTATTDKTKFDNLQRVNTMKGQLLSGMLTANDPALKQSLYTAALPQLKALGEDVGQYPAQYPGDDAVLAHAAGVGYGSQILADAKAYRDSQEGKLALAEKQKAAAIQDYRTGVSDDGSYQQWMSQHPDLVKSLGAPATYDPTFGAKLVRSLVAPDKLPEYDLQMQNLQGGGAGGDLNPTTIKQMVDARIDPVQFPQKNKDYYQAALQAFNNPTDLKSTPRGRVMAAIDKGAADIEGILKETDPNVQRSRINQAVATAVATETAKAKLSPDSFAGILDPVARNRAEQDYLKKTNDAGDKANAAEQLHNFVVAAQSGNKNAPGLVPLTELRAIVNRVNRNELQSVQGGGSWYDKGVAAIDSAIKGEPIAPAMLTDIDGMSRVMAQAVQRNYNYGVGVNHATFGSKVPAIDLTTVAPHVLATPLPKVLQATDKGKTFLAPNGKLVKITDVNPRNPTQFKTQALE